MHLINRYLLCIIGLASDFRAFFWRDRLHRSKRKMETGDYVQNIECVFWHLGPHYTNLFISDPLHNLSYESRTIYQQLRF